MKGETRQLDPEIAELVREVVRDGDARLLTAPRLEDVPQLAALRDPVRSTTPGLSRAERHLLQVHREEAAWLLRQASTHVSRSDPRAHVVTYADTEGRVDPPSREELAQRSRNLLTEGTAALDDTESVEALEALLAHSSNRLVGAARLAALSLRLLPSDEARICLAFALRVDERADAATSLLETVVGHMPSALNASLAWSNLGSFQLLLHEFEEARSAYRRAARVAANPFATMAWLFTACQLGDRSDALLAAAELDEWILPDDPAFAEYEACRRLPTFATSPQYTATGRAIVDEVGPAARRALDD